MAEQKLPVWPDWLPNVQQDDYSYEIVDRRTKTDMEVGSIIRVNFDTDEIIVNCSVTLNQLQAGYFEYFEKQLLRQGSNWFEIPLQTGGEIAMHKARFKSRPKASLPGPWHTTYSFSLELDKRPSLCPELWEILACLPPEAFCQIGKDMTKGLHQVIPSIEIPDFWAIRAEEVA